MDYPIDQYRVTAAATFTSLLKPFSTWSNGWQVGNVFDTLTDYVLRYPDEQPSPNAVVEAALERWEGVQSSLCWYDDYGWWGIASAKAFDDRYAAVFGPYRQKFQAIALGCWNVMHTGKPAQGSYKYLGGPNVWSNRDEHAQPGYFGSAAGWAAPRFGGGVWQYELFAGERKSPPECTPNHVPGDDSRKLSDPKSPSCPLGPYQLTVMNGLYLELALRLAAYGQGLGSLAAVRSEMAFLRAWFALPPDEGLLQMQPDGSALVRERVPTYAELNGGYPAVEGFDAASAWAGDQGLILGGLVDKVRMEPTNPTDPMDQSHALAVARGVLTHLVGDCGVLPYTPGFNVHGDADDYSCGSGVFWRYLLHAFEQNEGVRSAVLALVAANPAGNSIYTSAQMADSQACGSDNELFTLFNTLSTLTTAIEVLTLAGPGASG